MKLLFGSIILGVNLLRSLTLRLNDMKSPLWSDKGGKSVKSGSFLLSKVALALVYLGYALLYLIEPLFHQESSDREDRYR